MIPTKDVTEIARARLEDAGILLASKRYDGAIYLCGYAVELALKAKICRTLDWSGYPSTNAEFKDYRSFRTHDLDVLLHLSGREEFVKTGLFPEWSAVAQWNPEARYQTIGTTKEPDAQLMILAAKLLLERI
jgi:HEPN domain-containing protein